MVTLLGVERAALELLDGSAPASPKFALWTASLSGNKSLDANGRQARALAPFVVDGLPDRRKLTEALRAGHSFFSGRNLDTLYYIEGLDRSGQLRWLSDVPRSWAAWRESLYQLTAGHACGLKMISFAGLLLHPLDCDLAPVDRHVLARLGYAPDFLRTERPFARYLAVEDRLRAERDSAGLQHVPLSWWHWYKWSEYRQAKGLEDAQSAQPASHKALSCRWY